MIFSCPAKAFPKLISFTIQSPIGEVYGRYEAEEGMTWEQWVSSPYNIDAYKIVDWRMPGREFDGGPPFIVTNDSNEEYGNVVFAVVSSAVTDQTYTAKAYAY